MRMTRVGVQCLAAAALAALLYGMTLAPTVGAGDSGELILAADALGAPHPPGYPLWTLLAHLAALVPFGSIALRVNALSALLSAAAVGLFLHVSRRIGLRVFEAAVATVLFAASTVVWRAAIEAEVYPLATLCFLALATLALRARSLRTASQRSDAIYFFVAGLSLLAHQTLLFPAIFLGAWILARGFTLRRLLEAAGWALLGASLALFIPIRELGEPAFSWNGARGLPGLLDAFLRGGYGELRQNPVRLDLIASEIWGMAAVAGAAVGAVGALLAAAGALTAGRERCAIRVIAVAALTVPAALAALITFTPDPEHLAQVAPFLAPAVGALALLGGAGAGAALRHSGRNRVAAAAALACGAALTMGFHYAVCDRSAFRLAERYGNDLLRDLPQGATLVVDGDNETFLAAYATRIEGYRSDVALIHRRGYVFGDPYGLAGVPRARWVEVATRVDVERLDTAIQPIHYATPPEDLIEAGVRFLPAGLTHRAVPPRSKGGVVSAGRWVPPADWPRSGDLLPGGPERYDYVTRKMVISYSDAAARALWDEGRLAAAYPWFEDAARVGFDFVGARLNLATAAAATGRIEIALAELLAARTLAPRDPEPPARLAAFLAAAGHPRDAALWFEKAYGIRPAPAVASDAARAWTVAGDPERARVWTERAADFERAAQGSPAGRGIPG